MEAKAKRLNGLEGETREVMVDAGIPDGDVRVTAQAPAHEAQSAATANGGRGATAGKGKGDGKAGGKSSAAAAKARAASSAWSEDAEELMRLVQKLGPRNPNLCSEFFLKPFFQHLRFPELNIRELGDDTAKFSRLTSLDVSRNRLTDIDALPPNLQFLVAYSNEIRTISCKALPSLSFLGLGHNPLGSGALEQITKTFPKLLSLDLSYTELSDLADVLPELQCLGKLKQLCLAGSPVCLWPFYRFVLLRGLPKLQLLDGVRPSETETADLHEVSAVLLQRAKEAKRASISAAQSIDEGSSPGAALGLSTRISTITTNLTIDPAPTPAVCPAYIRLSLRPLSLKRVRKLLGPALLGKVPEALDDPPERDPIVVAAAGGALRLAFELPNGEWASTAPRVLEAEVGARQTEQFLAAKGAGMSPLPSEPFDTFFLAKLTSAGGEPLVFPLDTTDGEGGFGGLLSMCRWLRKGLHVKLFFSAGRSSGEHGTAWRRASFCRASREAARYFFRWRGRHARGAVPVENLARATQR